MSRNVYVLGAALLVSAVGCGEERSTLSDPAAPNAYGFQMLGPAAGIPRGSVVFRQPDSMTVTLQGLDSLATGFYTAWIGDSLGGSFTRATGTLVAVRTDTTFDTDGNPVGTPTAIDLGAVSSFRNGGPNQTFTWDFGRASSNLGAIEMATFLITIEESAGASTPHGSRRPLFARRAATGGGNVTRSLIFGNYAPEAVDQYVFAGAARGRGVFQETMVMMNDSSMSRPPVGYYYAMWMVKRIVGATTGWDTIFVGEQTSPWPRRHLSQFNADSIITDAAVVTDIPPAILAGSARLDADTVPSLLNPATGDNPPIACVNYGCPFLGFNQFWLTLENKAAQRGRMGPTRILLGTIPAVITDGVR